MIERPLRRCIVVPLGLHGVHRHSLETLVRIARQLDSTLLGLLLEDQRLQQVADLPFTTEINLLSGQETNLRRDQLSRLHGYRSEQSRRLLHELALRDQVELRFEEGAGDRLPNVLNREPRHDIFLPSHSRGHGLLPAQRRKRFPIQRIGALLTGAASDDTILNALEVLLRANLVGDVFLFCNQPLTQAQLRPLSLLGHHIRTQTNFTPAPAAILALLHHSAFDLLLLPDCCLQEILPATLDSVMDKAVGQVLIIH